MKVSMKFDIPDPEARDLLFGSEGYWLNLRAAVSEGFCPNCHGRLLPVPEHPAVTAGYCFQCNLTFFTGGPDKRWAESGSAVGWTTEIGGPWQLESADSDPRLRGA